MTWSLRSRILPWLPLELHFFHSVQRRWAISRASGLSMLLGCPSPSWLSLLISTVDDPNFYMPLSYLHAVLWLAHFLQITWPSSLRKHRTWFLRSLKWLLWNTFPVKYVSLHWSSPQPCQSRHVRTPSHFSFFVGFLSSSNLELSGEIPGTQLNWNFR